MKQRMAHVVSMRSRVRAVRFRWSTACMTTSVVADRSLDQVQGRERHTDHESAHPRHWDGSFASLHHPLQRRHHLRQLHLPSRHGIRMRVFGFACHARGRHTYREGACACVHGRVGSNMSKPVHPVLSVNQARQRSGCICTRKIQLYTSIL